MPPPGDDGIVITAQACVLSRRFVSPPRTYMYVPFMCYPTLPKVPTKKTFQQHTDGYVKGSSLKQTDIHPARVVTMYSHHPNRSQTTVCITLGTVHSLEEIFLSSRVNALDSLQPKPWHHSPDSLHIHANKHSLYLAPLSALLQFFIFFFFLSWFVY